MKNLSNEQQTSCFSDGESFYCNYCQCESILRKKNEYDGFTLTRSYFECAFCHHEIKTEELASAIFSEEGPVKSENLLNQLFNKEKRSSSAPEFTDLDSRPLPDLFGDTAPLSSQPQLSDLFLSEEGETSPQDPGLLSFCKNCAHHFENPFRFHCVLHNKDVNPMDDCPDFTPLKKD
ncbi:MAG: hypothetical protein WCS73_09465 [Lentisphaeria bacterium]